MVNRVKGLKWTLRCRKRIDLKIVESALSFKVSIQKKLTVSTDQFFEGFQVFGKGLAAGVGGPVRGVGLAAHELLLYFHVLPFFQRLQVAGQVAVGEVQQFLEGIEVEPV